MSVAAAVATYYRCRVCRHETGERSARCYHCGASVVDGAVALERRRGRRRPSAIIGRDPGETVAPRVHANRAARLVDVTPSRLRRLPSGDPIDAVLGGGFNAGKLYAFRGDPGAGKTRLAIRLAAQMCRRGPVCWITDPEHEEPKHDVSRHLREQGLHVAPHVGRLSILEQGDADAIARYLLAQRPVFAVIDSLSVLHNQAMHDRPPSARLVKYAAKAIRAAAETARVAVLAIFHDTNEGVMAGGAFLRYIVHGVLRIERISEDVSPDPDGGAARIGYFATDDQASPLRRVRPDGKVRGARYAEAIYCHSDGGLLPHRGA